MNILKALFTMFIVLVIVKMVLDFLCVGSGNVMEGMENKEEKEEKDERR